MKRRLKAIQSGSEEPIGCATTKQDLSTLSSWKEQSSFFSSNANSSLPSEMKTLVSSVASLSNVINSVQEEDDENKVSINFSTSEFKSKLEDEELF